MGLLCCSSVEAGCRVEPLGDTFTVESLELIVALTIFVVFEVSPPPWIYILNENKL